MSKGKKAKPGKKAATKPSKKAAGSKKAAKKDAPNSADAALAASDEETRAETAEAEETGSEETAASEESQTENEATEASEAAAAPQETSDEPQAIAADEVVATAEGEAAAAAEGGDDDVPVEPKGPDTPIADLPRADQKRLVESLVFVSDRAVNPQQLGRMLKIKSALAKELADELITEYEGRGIELVELSGGYQFRSAPSSAHVVREHISQPPVRLTRAQLETLALVAYRQPITRPEIDDVRGVDSGSALRVLLERGLLKMLGRKDEPGRPLLYGTTPFFLDFFGMKALKDLPTLREFTELSEENRALFKKKTGETIEEAEAALLAAEEAAQRDSLAAPSNDAAEGAPPQDEDGGETTQSAVAAGEGEPQGASEAPDEPQPEPSDRDLEVEAETFAAGSLQTSPDSSNDEEDQDEQELPSAPEA
jgi:segregation and condensation protein B